jgi:hypothetical protein
VVFPTRRILLTSSLAIPRRTITEARPLKSVTETLGKAELDIEGQRVLLEKAIHGWQLPERRESPIT